MCPSLFEIETFAGGNHFVAGRRTMGTFFWTFGGGYWSQIEASSGNWTIWWGGAFLVGLNKGSTSTNTKSNIHRQTHIYVVSYHVTLTLKTKVGGLHLAAFKPAKHPEKDSGACVVLRVPYLRMVYREIKRKATTSHSHLDLNGSIFRM